MKQINFPGLYDYEIKYIRHLIQKEKDRMHWAGAC
jgi:hypothetical protein